MMKNIILCILIMFTFSVFSGEMNILSSPEADKFSLTQTIFLVFEVSEKTDPTQFMLSKIEGPAGERVIFENSACNVSVELGIEPVTKYRFQFAFRPAQTGEGIIYPLTLTFINAAGDKTEKKTPKIVFSIVTIWEKYMVFVFCVVGICVFICFLVIVLKKINKRKKVVLREKEMIQFKQNKIRKEAEAIESFRGLGKHIIAGDYEKYAVNLLHILGDYFRGCHPLWIFSDNIPSFRGELAPLLSPEMQKRLDQILNSVEEIQFANVKPMQNDLDRLLQLTKELIADHRENFEEHFSETDRRAV